MDLYGLKEILNKIGVDIRIIDRDTQIAESIIRSNKIRKQELIKKRNDLIKYYSNHGGRFKRRDNASYKGIFVTIVERHFDFDKCLFSYSIGIDGIPGKLENIMDDDDNLKSLNDLNKFAIVINRVEFFQDMFKEFIKDSVLERGQIDILDKAKNIYIVDSFNKNEFSIDMVLSNPIYSSVIDVDNIDRIFHGKFKHIFNIMIDKFDIKNIFLDK